MADDEDAELYECEHCGKLVTEEDIRIGDDPYVKELYDERKKVCLCSECYGERLMDI